MKQYKYDSGLYPAVPSEHAENGEMDKVWIRDNYYIYKETGDEDIIEAFQKIIQKQKDNIREATENPPEYDGYHLHPRFDKNLEEIPGGWGYIQIDSYANLLQVFAENGMTEEADLMYNYIKSLDPLYREEYGIWEEEKKVQPYTMACLADAFEAYGAPFEEVLAFRNKFRELIEPDMSLALVLYRNPDWISKSLKEHIIEILGQLEREYGMARYPGDPWNGISKDADTEPAWTMGGLWMYGIGEYGDEFIQRMEEVHKRNPGIPEAMVKTSEGWEANVNTPLLWAEATYQGVKK